MKKSLTFIAIISLCAFAGAQESPASAQPQAKPAENTATQFGKNFVRISPKILSSSAPMVSSEIGTGISAELSFNVYKDETDTYGLNIAGLMLYGWTAKHADGARLDYHSFDFPAYLKPYYRFNVSEDLVITPHMLLGVGGFYEYYDAHSYGNSDTLNFYWAVGGGVEFQFFNEFAFTPLFEFDRTESNPVNDEYRLAFIFAWKFTKDMALFAEYEHIFCNNSDTYLDGASLGVRFEF